MRISGSGLRRLGFWTVAALATAIALTSYRYLLPGPPFPAPGPLANRWTHLGVLTAHAAFAATALLVGSFQFVAAVRTNHPSIHRRLGTVYVFCALAGGVAGLALSTGVSSGPVAGAGFGLLALAWMATTFAAWRLARARDLVRHRRWMIRSFALCLAAVTLRLYLPLSQIAGLPFERAYAAIAWICWLPNLAIAELVLNWRGMFARPAAPRPV
ncbi:MAG TPA: DUF2306 domain-containing protein [Caulobacteraceae bacterium]|nr:DUF2306 domain-containing protein [Caulobacteraceae bacterium]